VVVAVATVALVVAAIVGGFLTRTQIDEQRRIARRRRAYDHLTTFNSRSFAETSIEAERVFLRFKEKGADGNAIWHGVSDSERAAVQTVLNFYEESANEYNAQFLDPKAAEPLVFVTVLMWQEVRDTVTWLRRGNRQFCEQWQKLYAAKAKGVLRAIDEPADGT